MRPRVAGEPVAATLQAQSLSTAPSSIPHPNRSQKMREMIVVIATTLLAAGLRLIHLGSKSLWQDEAVSVFIARLNSAEFRRLLWNHELNMAAYYGLLRVWVHFGTGEFTVRLLSALAGIATVPVVYLLAGRFSGRRAAWVAALLLAVHPSHVAYSQEARGYAQAVLFCVLSSLFFVRGLSTDKSSLANWMAYFASSVVAVYSHLFAVLVIAAQWLSLLFSPRGWPARKFLAAAAAVTALLLPAAIFVATKNTGQLDWIPPITFKEALHAIFFLTGNGIRFALYLLPWMAAVGEGIRLARSHDHRGLWPYELLAIWLAMPVGLTVLVSLWKPILAPRFLSVCLPAAVLLAAAGSARLSQRWNAAVVTVLALASLNSVISYYRRPGEDWRAATSYVLSQAEAGDGLAIVPEYGHFPFDYYQQRWPAPAVKPVELQSFGSAKGTPPPKYKRTWLVIYQPESLNPAKQAALLNFSSDNGYRSIMAKQFTAIEVRLEERVNRDASQRRGQGALKIP